MSRRLKALAITMILIAAGCDDDPAQQIDRSVAQVIVNASATQVEEGKLVMVTAVAKRVDGAVIGDVDFTWTVSDTSIAAIAEEHLNSVLVRGKKAGAVTLTAKAEQKTASVQIGVTQTPVNNPVPQLQLLEPSATTEGSTGVVLHLKGSDFTPATFVQWNAVAKQTTFVSANELTVVVTPMDVEAAGEAFVRVITPGPGGGVTPTLKFTIYGPAVSLHLQETGPWPEVFLPGEEIIVEAFAKDRLGRVLEGVQVSWAAAVPATAQVDNNGRVRMVGPGQSRITARLENLVAETYVNVAADPGADVIYDAMQDGVRQLFVSRPGINDRTKLIPGVVHGVQPVPSPNGQKIAFVGTGTNGSADIFVVNRDGTGLRQLTNSPYEDRQPVWSPDGQWIAFSSNRNLGYNDIWIMNKDGGELENVTNTGVQIGMLGYEHPTWSPDGEYLIFEAADYGMTPRRSSLIRLALSTGARTNLTPQNDPFVSSDAEPFWAKNGTMLAIRRTFNNSNGDQIQFINPMTGETWLYIDYPGYGRNPSVSPNNAWVAFESTPRNITTVTGVYLSWIGTYYRRVIGAGSAAGYPANPAWLPR